MEINLIDPRNYVNGQPFDQMVWLQEHDPVSRHAEPNGGAGFWAVTRYSDVREIHAQPRLFSSLPTITIQDGYSLADENHTFLITSDAPEHTARRRFLGEGLSPSAVHDMADTVKDVVDEVLDDVIEKGECDLVWDVAGRLAAFTAAEVVGIPRADSESMLEVADRAVNAESTIEGDGAAATMELYQYASALRSDRLQHPRNDYPTRSANGVVAGVPNDETQFMLDFFMLFNGATDTSRNVLAGGMDAFFKKPGQWETLKRNAELVPAAVEEMVRWVSPIVYQRRTATADTQIGGTEIREGDKVASFFGAANRDPAVFNNPLEFDITADRKGHIAFGFGAHACLGQHLARLQLRTMLAEMVRRLPDIEPAAPTNWVREDLLDRAYAPTVVGPQSMPIRFTAGPRVRQ